MFKILQIPEGRNDQTLLGETIAIEIEEDRLEETRT